MSKIRIFTVMLSIILLFVIGGYYFKQKHEKSLTTGDSMDLQKSEDMIVYYRNGKKLIFTSGVFYDNVKNHIEEYASGCNDSYKTIFDEVDADKFRTKYEGIELIYYKPKEMKINYLLEYFKKDKVEVAKIFIPIKGKGVLEDAVFLYTPDNQFYTLINTNHSKSDFNDYLKSYTDNKK